MTVETIHPFEAAGLGLAPFRFAGMHEKVFQVCPGVTKPGGTCDYCSNGILYCFSVVSSDGKRFVVGSDCVKKLGRADNRLLSDVKRAEANFRREKKEEARKARWAEREAQRQAAEDAERERNGGMTDAEIRDQQAKAAAALVKEKWATENGWLLKVLDGVKYGSCFVDSMIGKLEAGPISGLSEKCVAILADIYAKAQGRRGSKKYEAAEEEFWGRVKPEDGQ